ncbi:MAG: T9SS type A sorting domain-containing protein, partial [Candidatus Marinimicrobia bacterium]|nr:T9SS type A sorting domain-containing protein [Candidatus Neomarinimicrobiota bacterium]
QSYNYRLLTDGATPDQSGQINIPPGASKKVLLPLVFDLPGEPINLQWIVTQSSASGVSDTIQYQIRRLNIPPRITSADSAYALEGSPFVYRATAVDADDSTLAWTFPVLPSWLTAQADSVYGTPLEGSQDTTFTAIVSDGEFSDTLSIALMILSTNDPPAITSTDSAEATEDMAFVYHARAEDPDGPTLIWVFEDLPRWLSGAADSAYGTPLEGDGDTSFVVIAWDGIWGDTLEVTITVAAVNDQPEAFALLSPGHESTLVITGANLGDTLTFAWDRAVDVEGDIVHYGAALTDGLGLLFTFGDTTGTEVRLAHADVVAIMEGLGQFTITGTWDIFATDGEDSTWASNGPFTFTIDATTLGIMRQDLLPGEFALRQNYPNPFNPSTTVRFDLPLATSVHLAVYDLLGREVLRLVDGHLEAGYHQRVWNGRDRDGREVPTGIYFVRLVSGEFSAVRKMILMK